MHGKGINNGDIFARSFLESLHDLMIAHGHEFIFRRFIGGCIKEITFAKTDDRRVTGSMNDLIRCAQFCLLNRDDSPHNVAVVINGTPMTLLKYGIPNKVFFSMLPQD